jgi:signal transduction histidine kinase
MNNNLDKKLLYNKEVIAKKLKYDYPLTLFEVQELTSAENRVYPRDTMIYKDTLIFHAIAGLEGAEEYEKYRQLTAYETLQGERLKIITRNSLVRNQDFIGIITLSTVIIILLLLTGLWILNTQIAKNIWKPFYKNLDRLKNFSIQDQEPINLEPTSIEEFKELNNSLRNLTQKLQSDFNNLKEFSENASHEMQTPLSIMQSKVELLLQSTGLKKEQIKQLQSIYQAGQRLSKLNKTLLLLAKVENQQFSKKEEISLKTIIDRQLENYEDFSHNKNLKVTTDLSNQTLTANAILAETLITNLLSNAIRHNIQDGSIEIIYNGKVLLFINTGHPLSEDPEKLFNRFKKMSVSKDSIGLGLAIVKKICEVNLWKIHYSYENDLHKILVILKS